MTFSDQSGEMELWQHAANGANTGTQQLTKNADVLRYRPVTSPNEKYIAFTDKNWRLWLYDVEADQTMEIYQSPVDSLGRFAWSPDSRWLAFVAAAENFNNQVYLYDVDNGSVHTVTSERVNSYSPAWDPDGDWLCFLSDRHLVSIVGSPWGQRQPEPYVAHPTKVYLLALRDDVVSPFLPKTELSPTDEEDEDQEDEEDQEDLDEEDEAPEHNKALEQQEPAEEDDPGVDKSEPSEESPGEETAADDDGEDGDREPLKIDLDNLSRRLYVAPVAPGRYSRLSATKGRLLWASYDAEDDVSRLMALDLERDADPRTIVRDIGGFELSANGDKVLLRRNSALYVFSAGDNDPDLGDSRVNLSDWRFLVNTRAEWRQMFVDAWRLERDYFYDRGMHGVDWEGLRDRYLPLVDRVNDRDELNNVIFQLVGELEALHIGVRGGDRRFADNDVGIASLGAVWERDEAAGGYRIVRIYQTDPDYPRELAPLQRPEVGVVEQDVIMAINHIPVLSVEHPRLLLRDQAGRQVLLSVKESKTGKNRDVVVVPMSMRAERNLRYSHWEYERRQMVEKQSNAKVGYLHLRAMSGRNYTEFARNFYPVFHREGLIIDVRHNRGGNIDSWILEKLMRKAWFYWQPRVGQPYWNMQYAFRGHMVVLCDEYTASDGEAFTEGFRRLKLGTVLGKRTWGGEIWLSADNYLVDDGIATAAEYGVYGPERKWLIEGHGVEPDIVVDNMPHATFLGGDQQLETAVEYLLTKIEEEPVPVPAHPDYPDKTP